MDEGQWVSMKSDDLNALLHHKYLSSSVSDYRCRHPGCCLRRIPRLGGNWECIVHLGDFACTDHFEDRSVSPLFLYRLRRNSPV